jgi:Cu+-exporting ATPase
MQVERANPGAVATHGGHTSYFCSDRCKTKYDSNPAKYDAGHVEQMSEGGCG